MEILNNFGKDSKVYVAPNLLKKKNHYFQKELNKKIKLIFSFYQELVKKRILKEQLIFYQKLIVILKSIFLLLGLLRIIFIGKNA